MNEVEPTSLLPTTAISQSEPLDTGQEAGSGDLIARVFDSLKRHWKWGLPLALVLAVIGGVAAYQMVPVTYTSTASIRVRPVLPKVLYQTEQANVMPMFDAFVESQVRTISSQQMVGEALHSPRWTSAGGSSDPSQIESFLSRLVVFHPKGTELITVAFTDLTPALAAGATGAIVDTYVKAYSEGDGTQDAQKIQLLESRRTTLTEELKALEDRIATSATQYGTTSLDKLYEFKLADLNRFEAELQQVRMNLALAQAPAPEPAAAAYDPAMLNAATVDELARTDPDVRRALHEIQALKRKVELLGLRLLPSHPDIIAAKAELDAATRDLDQYVQRVAPAAGMAAGSASAAEVWQLRQRERALTPMVDRAREETLSLGRKRIEIEGFRREIDDKQARLRETETRLEQLGLESGFMGRLSVMSYGDTTGKSALGKRKKAGAAGAAGGFGLGAAVAIAVGLASRKCRSLADAQRGMRRADRLLGILPSLAEDLSDPEQAAVAAHYVHHIRALLQLGLARDGPAAYVVTSAVSGSGKTSLTQALGLSFASSGARTLLIDCDIIGGGLSRRMRPTVRRKLGQILLEEQLITPEQLEIALQESVSQERKLGEILIAEGMVDGTEVERALALQSRSDHGVVDVLGGQALDRCVIQTESENLYFLPLGAATPQYVAALSPTRVRELLDQARARFDVVLIDTGPVPGSIEASMLAAEADQVILVVARGELRSANERALDYLLSVGADVAGVVFNRAKDADVQQSGLSTQSVETPGEQQGLVRRVPRRPTVSPVVQAVVRHVEGLPERHLNDQPASQPARLGRAPYNMGASAADVARLFLGRQGDRRCPAGRRAPARSQRRALHARRSFHPHPLPHHGSCGCPELAQAWGSDAAGAQYA